MSKSNVLPADVNAQIVTMLGQEHSVLRRASADRLEQLANLEPQKTRRGWFSGLFGKKSKDGVFGYSMASMSRLPTARGGRQWKCLSEALYFEARGESLMGQFAVAEVILNRVDTRSFPGTVCNVVDQGSSRLNACQFSYNCDGKPETISEPAANRLAGKIARIMLDGAPRTLTRGATYYHSKRVSPRWARSFTRTARIGDHLFYSDTRLASR